MKCCKRIRRIVVVMLMLLFAWQTVVMAAPSDHAGIFEKDGAENFTAVGDTVDVESGMYFGGFGAGRKINVDHVTTEDTIALAGMNIIVNDSSVGGSLFSAGMSINVASDSFDGNVCLAGADVSFKDSSARAAYFTGQKIDFDGNVKYLMVASGEAIISGTIENDAVISADKVTICPGTHVGGKCTIKSTVEPQIPDDVSFGTYEYEQTVSSEEVDASVLEAKKVPVFFTGLMVRGLYFAVAMSIVGILMCLLFPRHIERAGVCLRNKPGTMIGVGVLLYCCTPIAIIISICTIIGLPLAGLLLLMYILLKAVAVAFSGAVAGPMLIKGIHPVAASVIGIVAMEVIAMIPILGTVVKIACDIYILGYFGWSVWQNRFRKPETPVL